MTYTLANIDATLHVSGSLAETLGSAWSTVRFCRSRFVSGVWLLSGIPDEIFEPLMSRLFANGATYVAAGSVLATGLDWIAFKAPQALSAKLATLFEAPTGVPPLIVRKGRILSGAAERSALTKLSDRALGTVVKAIARLQPTGTKAHSPEAYAKTAAVLLQRVRSLSPQQAFCNGRGGEAWVLGSLQRGCSVRCWMALPNPWQVVPVAGRVRAPRRFPALPPAKAERTPRWLQERSQ